MSPPSEQALGSAADRFYRILSALASRRLLDRGDAMPEPMRPSLTEKLLDSPALELLAADGFALCVRALAKLGAPGVTIHECGASALGEQPWSGGDD